MPAQNVLANLFSTISNNEMRNKKGCLIVPASMLGSEVLRTMQRHKYIGEVELIDDGRAGKFRVQLLGRINKCGAISPRYAVSRGTFDRWERQYLPAVAVGILILTTTKGILSHAEAVKQNTGGRLLGYVY